jgi:cystathionine beta-lyase
MEQPDYQAIQNWISTRHRQNVPREWLLATPGVIYAMRAAQYVMTKPGDQIVVMPPVHTPFFVTASRFDRQLVTCPLLRDENGYYTIDYAGLERCFAKGARMLLICSPQNPIGRVWTRTELEHLAELCIHYKVYIISDEIHRDILMPGSVFTPLDAIPGLAERTFAVFSPSKTFNMGGFHIATAVIPDPDIRAAVRQRLSDFGHSCGRPTLFSIVAQTAAYSKGGPWVDALIQYLNDNFTVMLEQIDGLPLKALRPEGTYMFWVDCSALHLNTDELMSLMLDKAGVFLEPGHIFDSAEYQRYKGPQTHIRLNAAMPRTQIMQALAGIRRAVQSIL